MLKKSCPYHQGPVKHTLEESKQAVLFFTDIVHRFGVPNTIITDNGTQFTGRKFLTFCDDHHICGPGQP